MALIAGYIPENRIGEGMGYFGLGQTLAMAVGPALGLVIGNRFGFNLTFFVSCGFLLAAMVLALIVTGSERAEVIVHKNVPIRELIRPSNFFAKDALLFGAFAIAISSLGGLESSFLALYGKQLGMANIGWYFTLSAVVMFVSRMVFGRIMDKKGFAIVFFPGMAAMAAALLLFGMATPASAVAIFAAACILKSLGAGAIQPSLQAQCIMAVKPEKRGAAASTYYFGADIGQGTSPIIGGAIAQSWGYSSAFLVYMLPILLATALYGLFIGIRKSKRRKSSDPVES
jgi:predicted MFS family arabinose efflux permease